MAMIAGRSRASESCWTTSTNRPRRPPRMAASAFDTPGILPVYGLDGDPALREDRENRPKLELTAVGPCAPRHNATRGAPPNDWRRTGAALSSLGQRRR